MYKHAQHNSNTHFTESPPEQHALCGTELYLKQNVHFYLKGIVELLLLERCRNKINSIS